MLGGTSAVAVGDGLVAHAADEDVRGGRGLDFFAGEALGFGADASADGFPVFVVAVLVSGECVSDFVEDDVADGGIIVELDEVPGEADGAGGLDVVVVANFVGAEC